MNKEETIQLHMFLIHIKNNLENLIDNIDPLSYVSYDTLDVPPYNIHRSKRQQTHAVFELCKGIASVLSQDDMDEFGKTVEDLEKICARFRKK